MFKTYQSAEVFNPFAEANEKYWSYAEMGLHLPWFYVQYSRNFDDESCHSMFIFSRIEQLQELAENPSVKIIEVNVVTPGYINKSDSWQMGRLTKILKGMGVLEGSDAPIFIYVLTDGTEILYSLAGGRATKHTKFETVFSIH